MNLNEEVVGEILLRLPAKSLLRFRSVCKTWCGLIKSNYFIENFNVRQRAIRNDRIIVKHMEGKKEVLNLYEDYELLSSLIAPPEVDIPRFPEPYYDVGFMGEANGIVFISNYRLNCLMNPALREFRMLPEVLCSGAYRVGFGFDEASKDYKLVRIDEDKRYRVGSVYNISNNSRRDLGRITFPRLDDSFPYAEQSSIFFNGSIHWYGRGDGKNPATVIITFNMATESFQEMQPPQPLVEDNGLTATLLLLDKSYISMVSLPNSHDRLHMLDVWVMKEYGVGDSWTKEYRIETKSIIDTPLSFWKKDKIVLRTSHKKLICYDLLTGQLHKLRKFDSNYNWLLMLVVYNENLHSINTTQVN